MCVLVSVWGFRVFWWLIDEPESAAQRSNLNAQAYTLKRAPCTLNSTCLSTLNPLIRRLRLFRVPPVREAVSGALRPHGKGATVDDINPALP